MWATSPMSDERQGRRPKGAASAEAIGDTTLGQVVRGHLDHDLVAGQHADAVLAHLARGVGDDLMAVGQQYPECGVGQQLADRAFKFQQFFLGHSSSEKGLNGGVDRTQMKENQAESGSRPRERKKTNWIPAFAGMTG
jgi:hypothetical protein